ncbi:MAG: cytoplasmic protein [Deltaproteobacteria bacterium RBG_13_52_11]|nr:MAG: cytoplasmic protein [Deltaproteobacteria bacterium RBG_13_52_11]
MTRREVLKLLLAGAVLTPWPWRAVCSAATQFPPDVVISRGTSPALITEAAVLALGGMGRFVSRGDVVLVKPNIAWDRTPEQAATTNPELVATLVRLCLEAGAKEVKVFDNPCEDPRRSYVSSGIMAAAKKAGANVSYMEERKFRRMEIKGEDLKTWEVYQEAMEVDKIINCPILKHHSLARVTMGMKNLMGLVGGDRGRIHWKLDQAIVDLAAFFKPTLVVLDAIRILTANGPQGGSLKYVKRLNTVAAGIDQVAIDAMGARLFGLQPKEMDHLRIASQRGLGRMDLTKLRIKEVKADS